MNTRFNLVGWKTVLFNVAVALIPVIDLLTSDGKVLETLLGSPERAAATITVLGSVNVLLRALTKTPIFKKEPKE